MPSDVTPDRKTRVFFDVPEYVIREHRWQDSRTGAEIASLIAPNLSTEDTKFSQNMKFWSSGCWTLRPIEEQITNISERTDYEDQVIPLPQWNVITGARKKVIKESPRYRKPDLVGVPTIGLMDSGDLYLKPHVEAGGTWDNSLPSSQPGPTLNVRIPVDRIGESKQAFPPDQGFFLRWESPGNNSESPDNIWTFYFGQYSVHIHGNGIAELGEYCHDSEGLAVYRRRDVFRYAGQASMMNSAHTLTIFPHLGPHGEQYIVFAGNRLDTGGIMVGALNSGFQHTSVTNHTYKADIAIRGSDQDEAPPGHVTKEAIIRYDIRRDMRLQLQISKIGFYTEGQLVDHPFGMPTSGPIPSYDLSIQGKTVIPAGTAIHYTISDADHPGELFDPARGDFKPYVIFDFSSDGHGTPILWNYELLRDQLPFLNAPGHFEGGLIQELAFTGPDDDPSHEAGRIRLQDIFNATPRLRNRGRYPIQISVNAPVGKVGSGKTADIVLFRGHAYRPTHVRHGINRREYPSPEWHESDLAIFGMWGMLAERQVLIQYRQYATDPTAPIDHNTNQRPPWKVTDAIRDAIGRCGFPASQIDIEDSAIRLFTGIENKADDQYVMHGDTWAEWILRVARNYLGATLFWDANSGDDGQWRLLFGTPVDAAPIYHFTTVGPDDEMHLPHHPGSYPANTTFVDGRPETQVIKPEFNHLWVMCDITAMSGGKESQFKTEQHLYNPYSYYVPGFDIIPDPDDPDFLGYELVMPVYDASLRGNTPQETQDAVDFWAYRLAKFAGHAQYLKRFKAPLNFVQDARTGRWRPMRRQDPVTFNGQPYFVKNCNPEIKIDKIQMAEYELIQPIARPGGI